MGILTGELHKLVFGGSLATTETWACSIHMMTADLETVDPLTAIEAMDPPLRTWFTKIESYINQAARLEWIKLNKINKPDGLYADAGAANTFYPNPLMVPNAVHPYGSPQLSQCISFSTDVVRGRASKGRIYPPSITNGIGGSFVESNGLINTNQTGAMADAAQILLAELNNATPNLTCVVWSQVGQVGRAIETVRVGRVVDTQQRRRNNLVENYVPATAPV